MKTVQLDYQLPEALIAQQPPDVRTESRLLVVDRKGGRLTDTRFSRVAEFLRPGDCLVLNDTKVLPARFFARRLTGRRLEGLFLAERQHGVWEVMIKGSGRLRLGEEFALLDWDGADAMMMRLEQRLSEGRNLVRVDCPDTPEAILNKIGHPPLPPYIKRADNLQRTGQDMDRYQTVYAQHPGAVAAPTAGLHFTHGLIDLLRQGGIDMAYLTLHVGTGTFKPVTTEELEDHSIHPEQVILDGKAVETINRARQAGGRIIAVGTTSTRALESAAVQTQQGWQIRPFEGQTRLFITPGCPFRIVDAMITNFHLPRSTLLALVAAFTGLDLIMAAYKHAIEQRYRFYSYGDAMIIL